ncbi:alpha/beta hydrolase [Mycolicibacterium sp. jd]|uniref:alpha/beta hydrolase n=1 Tax=unclassified Mycolicibacterium TaxID=2636767 RepID=UPI00351BC1E8
MSDHGRMMGDRYRVWLGAGVLAGGVSAAMLAGAGVAAADDGTSSGSGSQAASGSDDADGRDSKAGPAAESGTDQQAGDEPDAETPADEAEPEPEPDEDPEDEDPEDEDPEDEDLEDEDPEPDADADADRNDRDTTDEAPAPPSGGKHAAPEPEDAPAEPEPEPPAETPAVVNEPETGPVDAEPEAPSTLVDTVETDLSAPDGAAVMKLAAASSPWPGSGVTSLVDFVENLAASFYDWYTDTMQFLAGPARAPFGSRVRVERSSLTVGEGVVVSADWYFPPGNTPPKGLIYLQHGMLASASFYSATAAYLAEKTHSIVVAPTLTWNVLDTENYPLLLPSTHRAVAELFTGDRAELTASAREAGFTGELPTRVVLAGHSAGGGLVVGTARYMVENGDGDDLAGVVMLDGAGIIGVLSADLAKIPQSIPVYNLAATPDSWNNNGHASQRLKQARPDMFTGVLVQGGHHSDSMQSASGIVQFMAYLATGFSSPWNVEANEILTAGWINDMLDGTHTERLYRTSVSPFGLVTGAWIDPPSSVRVGALTAATAGAGDVCPVTPTATTCADPLPQSGAARGRAALV